MPQRLHRQHFRDRMPEGSVGCARPSRFGNPFTVAAHGRAAECVRLFETAYVNDLVYRAKVRALRGKDLWCYCALDAICHVDLLLAWANEETLDPEHEDDLIELAASVSVQQREVLRLLRYHGPSPSTGPQAAGIIHELLCVPTPEEHA